MSEQIEVWDKVSFDCGEPTKWERSLDQGKTWEIVDYPGERIPFVLCNFTDETAYVIQKRLESKKVEPSREV